MSERFYVREHSGYLSMTTGSRTRPVQTEVMVIDRDYCHRVDHSALPDHAYAGHSAAHSLVERREFARERCAELNAWHERMMAA